MATLFFAREGSDPNRSGLGTEIDLTALSKHYGSVLKQYFVTPPLINPDANPSPYSKPKLVVVSVQPEEVNDVFTKTGFYYLPDVSPEHCAETLGISIPQ